MRRSSCAKPDPARQRGGAAAVVVWLLVLAGLGALLLGALAWEIDRRLAAEGLLEEERIVWIERGDGLATVEEKLADLGALGDPRLFRLAARIEGLGASLRAGEFALPPRASVDQIILILEEGKPVLRFVTIPEGLTSEQAMRIVQEAPVLEGETGEAPPEGSLLPETYAYQRGEERAALVQRMKEAHDEALAELWPQRAADLPFDTPEEAVILASIVEKETAVASERPRVAAVFVNRLRRGMRLQSDPTIIYGLTGGEPLGRGIRVSELKKPTPYNTYVIDGLPPTPIANPGRASLAAVLNPAETDDLYFVADGSGGHVFATTLAQHNRNVAAWRKVERERAQ